MCRKGSLPVCHLDPGANEDETQIATELVQHMASQGALSSSWQRSPEHPVLLTQTRVQAIKVT